MSFPFFKLVGFADILRHLLKILNFSLREEWETHGQSFFWQRIRRLLEHISSNVWENWRGRESGPECGGIGSVIELAMAKQVYKKVDHLTMTSLRSFDSFTVKASLKIILVYFFLVTMSIFSSCLKGFVVPLFCSQKVLSFCCEIFKRLLDETHVFGRTFIFCIFLCNGVALNLIRHVVDLSMSLSMSLLADTTLKLSMSRLDFLNLVLQSSNG